MTSINLCSTILPFGGAMRVRELMHWMCAQRLGLSQRQTRRLSEARCLRIASMCAVSSTRPDPNHREAPVKCGAHEARGD